MTQPLGGTSDPGLLLLKVPFCLDGEPRVTGLRPEECQPTLTTYPPSAQSPYLVLGS